MNVRPFAMLFLLTLAVAACGTGASSVPDAETGIPLSGKTAEESPLSPAATPPLDLSKREESPVVTPSETTAPAVAAAKERLGSELDASTEAIEIVAIEPVEWSDASLGCPEPGEMYAQVITPGYRITLRVAEREYEVHTDRSGRAAVICEPEP